MYRLASILLLGAIQSIDDLSVREVSKLRQHHCSEPWNVQQRRMPGFGLSDQESAWEGRRGRRGKVERGLSKLYYDIVLNRVLMIKPVNPDDDD